MRSETRRAPMGVVLMVVAAASLTCGPAFSGAAQDVSPARNGWEALWANDFASAEQYFTAALNADRKNDSAQRGLVLALLARGRDDALHEALDDYARRVPASSYDYFVPDVVYLYSDLASRDYHESLYDFAGRLAESGEVGPIDRRMYWSTTARYALMAGDERAVERAAERLNRIDTWYVLGPFDNTSGCGHKREHAYSGRPTDAPYRGKFGQTISWFTPELISPDRLVHLTGYFHHDVNTTGYARTTVRMPRPGTYLVSVGYTGEMEFAINDVVIGEGSRHAGGDEVLHWLVDLPAGTSLLSFKVSNRGGSSLFSCAVSERDGSPVKDIEFDVAGPIVGCMYEELAPRPVVASFLEEIERRVRENPGDTEAAFWHLHRARLHAEPDSLQALCDELTERFPESALVLCAVAEVLGGAGEEDRREQLMERAAELAPDLAPATLHLARGEMEKKRYEQARSRAQSVLQRSPSCRRALQIELECLLREQRLEELRTEAERVADELRDESLGYTFLAEHASERGLTKDEKKYSRKAIDRMPVYTGRLSRYIESLEEEDYSQAQKDLERFLRVSPDSEFLWVSYVRVLLSQDRIDEAWETAQKALRSFPQSVSLIYYRALFCESCYDFWLTSIREHFPDGQRVLTDEELKAMYPNGYYPTRVIKPEDTEATRKWIEHRCNAQAADMLEKALDIAPGNFQIRDKIRSLRGRKPYRTFMVDPALDEFVAMKVDPADHTGEDAVVLREWKRRLAYDEHASVLDYVLAVQLLNEEGVRRWEDYDIGIDPHANDIVFLEQTTVKPDGMEHEAEIVGGTVVFANVEPGDVIFLHYQMTAFVVGALSGRFWDHHQFSFGDPCLESKYVLITPEDLEVETRLNHAGGYPDAVTHEVDKLEDGYRLESWTFHDPPVVDDEIGSPPPWLHLPWIDVSTVGGWSDIAAWYEDLALGQAEVTSSVREKAEELASGAVTDDEIIARVLRFVADEVTYRYVPFYQGAQVPREAEQVLKDRAGDCKDKCVLMMALLEAAGVTGCRPALVTPGTDASVSFLPSPRFSHVVLYHEKTDGTETWYDPTVRFAVPGELPMALSGAPALVVSEEENALREIPRVDVRKRPSEITTSATLSEEGSADVKRREVYTRIDETSGRRVHVEGASRDELEEEALTVLAAEHPGCELTSFAVLGSDDPDTSLVYEVSFHAPRLFAPTADILSGALPSGSRLNNAFGAIVAGRERRTPIDLRPFATCSKLVTTLEFPDGLEPLAVPEDCSYRSGGCVYSATYTVADGALRAERQVVIPGTLVHPDDYADFKTFLEATLQDLQAPVLLR